MARLSFRYEIVAELGRSAEAVVYHVLDLLQHGAERALKLSSRPSTPQETTRLGRELAILSRLHHPQIAGVHDFGLLHQDDLTAGEPRAFYTRDLVDGTPIPAAGSPKALAKWAESLLRVLGFLHARDVLHRDLRPDNILLSSTGGNPLPVLIDFGLSGNHSPTGTVAYAAPELLRGEPASTATDLYALGATLLELASGAPPVDPARPEAAIQEILAGGLQARVGQLARAPRALVSLLQTLLDPEPTGRPASAPEALTRLTGAAEEVPDTGVTSVPPFVGRRLLLAKLAGTPIPNEAKPPAGQFIQVLGEGGSGKTRLLSELRWRLQLDRRPVVQISCRTGARRGSLGVFLDAVRWQLPSGGTAPKGSSSRQSLFEELWQAFERVAQARGLWLLVDDSQEADPDGRAWLRFLSRAAPDGGLTTIAMARPAGALEDLSESQLIHLAPLGQGEAHEILTHLTGDLPARGRDAATDLAMGNPALLTQLGLRLRQLGPDLTDVASLATLKMPASLVEAEQQRLTAVLGSPPWPVLERLAVCDQAVDQELLIQDSDPGVHQSQRDQLRQLLEAGVVLCRDGSCGTLEPWTRDGVLAGVSAQRREAHHQDWIARLTASQASTVHVAHHRIHAGYDRTGLPEVLAAARELRAQGATGRSAQYLEWCVETATEAGATPDILARHSLELAELLAESGRLDEAAERLRALDADQLPSLLATECTLAQADLQEKLGQLDEAEQTLSPLGASEHLTRPQESRLALHRARLAVRRGRHSAALDIALRGAAAAEKDSVRSALLNVAAVAETSLGDHAAATGHLAEAIGLAAKAGDSRAEAVAVNQLALANHSQGQLAEAETHYRRSLELAEGAGLHADLPGFMLNLATVLQERGRLGEALGLFQRAAALARRLGHNATLANALTNYGNLMMELGAHAEAERTLRDAQRRAQQVGLPVVQAMTRLYLAEAGWRQGRLEDALRDCVQAADELGALDLSLRRYQALLTAAEIALDADQPEESAKWLDETSKATGSDATQLAGRRALLGGRLSARDPARGAEAKAEFDAAARWAAERGDRFLAAAAAFGQARLSLSEGDTDPARNHAEAALATQRDIAQDVPTELREQFWLDPRRAAVATLLEQLTVPASAAGPPGLQGPALAQVAAPHLLRILRFNRDLLAERDTARLLERVMDTAVELTEAERGFLLLRSPDPAQKLRVEVARNIDRETLRRGGMTFSRSLAQEVAETGVPILTVSAQDDARLGLFASVSELRLKSVMSVPIRTSDRILGTLYLDNRFVRGRFSEPDLELLQAFADQVAVVLENARLTDALETRRRELERARTALERLNSAQATELAETKEALAHARQARKREYPDIIGRSPAMRRVLALVDRVVDHDVPVLIGGESGTGKELLARTLHSHGPRQKSAFVAINCGALPESLLESELFGHVKGAFPGADRDHDGLFRVAHGGTLLLGEVGEMSPAMQSKLLRVLQEREIRPVGSNRDLAVDVRILAATNRDLRSLVNSGDFRQDLFDRLNAIPVVLPPLRERPEDLPALADFFAGRAAQRLGLPVRRLTKAALRRLLSHPWPGNVRELENVIANALLMADGDTVGPPDLTLTQTHAPRARRGRRLQDVERDAVEAALRETGGNRTRAAELLGISRVTLQRRLKKWRQSPGD